MADLMSETDVVQLLGRERFERLSASGHIYPIRKGSRQYLASYVHLRLEEDRRLGGGRTAIRKGKSRPVSPAEPQATPDHRGVDYGAELGEKLEQYDSRIGGHQVPPASVQTGQDALTTVTPPGWALCTVCGGNGHMNGGEECPECEGRRFVKKKPGTAGHAPRQGRQLSSAVERKLNETIQKLRRYGYL